MDRLRPTGANAPQIEYWNGPAGERWAQLADTQDRMLEELGVAAIEACDIRPGHTVLDAGCGSGWTSLELARRVGETGHVLGIDLSARMLDVARARLASNKKRNLAFDNQDLAAYPFAEKTFDRVYSRFGVMFFVDPVAAFINLRKGMKSGARLGFVCWQALDRNPWMEIPLQIALRYVAAPPPNDPEAPGPMAFADPDRVRRILSTAGFEEIDLQERESQIPFEADARSTARQLVHIGGAAARLLATATDDIKARVEEDLSQAIAGYQTNRGVRIAGTTWIVTATSP